VVVNVALASLGYLQLLLLLFLSVPAGIFARAVRDVTKNTTDADSGSDGSAPPQA
jgi:hypothetical protein